MIKPGIITIFHGYHVDTPVPEQVYKDNLGFRFAIIFETAFPEHNSSYFQSNLFMELVSAISQRLNYDKLLIVADENSRYQAIDSFKEGLFKISEDDRMPPQQILFHKNDTLICIEDTEFWALCGGPVPFSDSYTASFYTKHDMTNAFDTVCENICSDMGAKIRKRIQGSPHPVRSFWKTFRGH